MSLIVSLKRLLNQQSCDAIIMISRSRHNPRSRCAWLTGPEPRSGYARTSFGIDATAEATILWCNLWKSWTPELTSEFSHAHLTILTQGGMPTASRPCKPKKCKTTKNISIFFRAKPKSGEKKSNISKMGGWVGVVLGQVSDRDAQHRPLTRNATMVKKGGCRNYTFCPILMKKWVKIRHFPRFCGNIGVETIQIFQRPEKGQSKWRSICSGLHIHVVSLNPKDLINNNPTLVQIMIWRHTDDRPLYNTNDGLV